MHRFLTSAIALAVALVAAPSQSFAHHVMGGGVPDTLMSGLLSGFGHPIIGIDHLAFIVLVGISAAFTTRRLLTPLVFIAATLLGCMMTIAGVALPYAEVVITASVVLVGGMVVSGHSFPAIWYMVVYGLAGVFHGWAYGESIIGAEPTPVVAYLVGFGLVQYAIALATGWVVLSIAKAAGPDAVRPRLAGAVAAGVGLAFLVENIEGMMFG